MRELLRSSTALLHARVEHHVDLVRASASLDGYIELLRRLLGFYRPLDHALSTSPFVLPFAIEQRAMWIEQDLAALGVGANVSSCSDLPALDTCEQLAGCLYVVEGAALGGRVIAKTVRARLGLTATRFFDPGDSVGPRWRRVVAWLDSLPAAGASSSSIVAAAAETFESFERWMSTP